MFGMLEFGSFSFYNESILIVLLVHGFFDEFTVNMSVLTNANNR